MVLWLIAMVALTIFIATMKVSKAIALVGRVQWPGDNLLPAHSRYRVSLVDLKDRNKPVTIASGNYSLKDRGAAMPFELSYQEKQVKPDRPYGLWAEIIDGDRVIYNSGLATPLNVQAGLAINLRVRAANDQNIVGPPSLYNVVPEGLAGRQWRIELAKDGQPTVLPDTTLIVGSDGMFVGSIGGYEFVAQVDIEAAKLQVVDIDTVSTADPNCRNLQVAIFQALLQARRHELKGRTWHLLDDAGKIVLSLAQADAAIDQTLH